MTTERNTRRLPRVLARSLVAFVLAVTAGCTTANERTDAAPPPNIFTADDDHDGPAVYLRARAENEAIVVDVFARGAAGIHGVAFRLTWDPAAIAFASSSAGTPWSKQAITLAKEGSPGELAVVWAERGELQAIDASGETRLGTLRFDAPRRPWSLDRSSIDTRLAFRVDRSKVVDRKGKTIDVEWRGGALKEISSRGVVSR